MAVRFDADGESYTRATGLTTVTDFSFACWVKLAADRATTTAILQIDNGSGTSKLRINAWNGTAVTFQTDSGGWFGNFGHVLTVGTWTFVGVSGTANPGNVRTAAREAGSTTWAAATSPQTNVTINAATLRIGDGQAASEWLNGSVAAVKVWSAALSLDELEQESWTYLPRRTSGLRGWYPLLTPSTVDYSGLAQTLSGGSGAVLDDGPPLSWSQGRTNIVRFTPPADTPKTLTESASATEVLAVSSAPTLADAGSAAQSLAASAAAVLADAASAAQALTASATIALADGGGATDTFSTGVPKPVGDTASAADSFAANATVPLAQAATGADSLTANVTVKLADVATAADAIAAGQLLAKTLTDTASATDALSAVITREITGAGAPYMAWAADAPEVRWQAGQPYSPWAAAAPTSAWSASPPSTRYSAGPPALEEVS